MKNMTLEEIAVACGGIYYGDDESYYKEVSSVVIDKPESRKRLSVYRHSRCKSGWTHVHPADDPGRRSVCALRKAD